MTRRLVTYHFACEECDADYDVAQWVEEGKEPLRIPHVCPNRPVLTEQI